MRLSRQRALCSWTVVLSLVLCGCSAAPAQTPQPTVAVLVAPTTAPVAAPTPPATRPAVAVVVTPTIAVAFTPTIAVAVAPPTPTFERVRAAEPTVGAIQPHGVLSWRDEVQNNDALQVSAEDLPSLPSDWVYTAWLQGKDQNLFLGILGTEGAGAPARAQSLTFVAPDHANLLDGFTRVTIAQTKPAEAPGTRPIDAVLAGALPEEALVQVRQVLVSTPATPKQLGFALGLRQQSDLVLLHAQFLRDAVNENNLANLQFHAEHLVNIIEGEHGAHYGDLNGNGKIENPGDGFGLLQNGTQDGYIKGTSDHAGLAASAGDATDGIKVHATHVQIAGENTRVRVSQIRDIALEVGKARRTSDAADSILRIVAVAQQTIHGVDLNGDELIAPVKGEGGVLTAYQHAQLMAGIDLVRPLSSTATSPTAVAVVQPTVAPTRLPTTAPTGLPTTAPTVVSQAPARPTEVQIADDAFAPKAITVPVGTVLIWTRTGAHPHTVTADDGSFDSGLLRGAETFQRTFDAAGVFAYYCDVHGGPGGVAMSGVVTVK
jgi:plastocyanin